MENQIFLYPGKAPGSENVNIEEVVFEEEWEPNYSKRIVRGVTAPSIIPFIPEKPNGTAVIVIPGGSYKRQVMNLEGTEIAKWLNSFGVAAFILKHRMPGDGHENAFDVPLQDAQRAVRLIRSNSSKFGVNLDKLGVMGFSAGGHLASTIGTCYDKRVYEPIDEIDNISAKPDFLVLCYPVISYRVLAEKTSKSSLGPSPIVEFFKKYSTEELVTMHTPPTFIMVADDDTTTPAEHSVSFYLALRKAGVTAELHSFKLGKHGFGIGANRGPVKAWTELCRNWIEML